MDHSTPTVPVRGPEDLRRLSTPAAAEQITAMEKNCADFGVKLYGFDSDHRGIVHVIGPELGATQPGKTIVCGDSHTSTHGAFGALAFGIGSTEVGHVLATQCLLQRKPKTLSIEINGGLPKGVNAKDIILAIIGKIGVDGGTGHVIEYRGDTIKALSMDQRMTICNMSIEAGARAGMIAPDETTYDYLQGRPLAPQDEAWEQAVSRWQTLPSDEGARFDQQISLNVDDLAPMVTYGTNPGMVVAIDQPIPDSGSPNFEKALQYMQIESGRPLLGQPVDVVFIGSCTNSRISDLQAAADILDGRKIADGIRLLVVPGSQQIKAEAEALGLHRVFQKAGAEWRESGLLHVLGYEWGHRRPRQAVCEHQQSKLRGPARKGGSHHLGEPANGSGYRRKRRRGGPPALTQLAGLPKSCRQIV